MKERIPRVFLLHGHVDDAVYLDATLILADDDDAANDLYPAADVARHLAEALGVRVEEWDFLEAILADADWNYGDVTAWVQTLS